MQRSWSSSPWALSLASLLFLSVTLPEEFTAPAGWLIGLFVVLGLTLAVVLNWTVPALKAARRPQSARNSMQKVSAAPEELAALLDGAHQNPPLNAAEDATLRQRIRELRRLIGGLEPEERDKAHGLLQALLRTVP